jgi:hypothetical protein
MDIETTTGHTAKRFPTKSELLASDAEELRQACLAVEIKDADGESLNQLLEKERQYAAVNHPSHYTQYEKFEVIDVCEELRAPDGTGNFNRGNAFKYLARAGWKNPAKHAEDLEKAKFYIEREIERVQRLMDAG